MLRGKRCEVCYQERFLLTDGVCDGCIEARREEAQRQRIAGIPLSTSFEIVGRQAVGSLGIVSTEVAIGMSIFKDIANTWRDFVGGRSQTVQQTLQEARRLCLDQLKQEAFRLEADGVVSVSLNFNEASTGSGGILFIVATGTAVKLRPEEI